MLVSRKTALPGVRAIDVFATEGHRWFCQTTLQNWQRIDEAVASSHQFLREGLENNRVTLAIRSKTRMRGGLHELRGNYNLARVIDLDNHRKLLLSMIVRLVRKLVSGTSTNREPPTNLVTLPP